MSDAPFLIEVRRMAPDDPWRAPDDEPDADPGAETAASAEPRSGVGGFEADDFPAWYHDRLDSADSAGPAGLAGAGPAGSLASVDPMGWVNDLAAVRTLEQLVFGPVTVLAGDNGTGKSTLVEAIAIAAGFNPEGGSRNLGFATHDTHSPLADELILAWKKRPRWGWFLRAETFYGMATHIATDPYLAPSFPDLHRASHGESFLALAEARFRGAGLYLLDEPESALSIQGQRRLAEIMTSSLAAGSQFIVSTHSPVLMAFPGATVIEVDDVDGLQVTSFENLEATRHWRAFWQDPAAWFAP